MSRPALLVVFSIRRWLRWRTRRQRKALQQPDQPPYALLYRIQTPQARLADEPGVAQARRSIRHPQGSQLE